MSLGLGSEGIRQLREFLGRHQLVQRDDHFEREALPDYGAGSLSC